MPIPGMITSSMMGGTLTTGGTESQFGVESSGGSSNTFAGGCGTGDGLTGALGIGCGTGVALGGVPRIGCGRTGRFGRVGCAHGHTAFEALAPLRPLAGMAAAKFPNGLPAIDR